MSINRVISRRALRWSEIESTYWKVGAVNITFQTCIKTRALSLFDIKNTRSDRHELILKMNAKGHADQEIADYLNTNGLLSPRGTIYSRYLVNVTRYKLRLREKRRGRSVVETTEPIFEFILVDIRD
mgnify:CR=1 FL=1